MTDVSTNWAKAIDLRVKFTLKMASARVVETTVLNSQDSNHPDESKFAIFCQALPNFFGKYSINDLLQILNDFQGAFGSMFIAVRRFVFRISGCPNLLCFCFYV